MKYIAPLWPFGALFGTSMLFCALAPTSHGCCSCRDVDCSSDAFELSDEDLFGDGASLPEVFPLQEKHADRITLHREGVFLESAQDIVIQNGSLLGFTDPGVIGRTIQTCSTDTRSGFSHVGLAITGLPSEMMNIVLASIKEGGLSQRKEKYQKAQIETFTTTYPYLKIYLQAALTDKLESPKVQELLNAEENDVFCFESTGTPDEVLRGIAPRVRLTPLSSIVSTYNGNLCVRSLNEGIALSALQPVLAKELGVSYEKKILQLIGSTRNRNRKEDSNSWFCSELAAHIYKLFDRLNDPLILANNVTPNQFQSWFEGDLLCGKAGDEIYLKEYSRELQAYQEQMASLKHKVKSFKNGKWPAFQIVHSGPSLLSSAASTNASEALPSEVNSSGENE